MYRIRRRALALLTALVCLMPTQLRASASEDPLLDFIKVVAPEAISGSIEAAPAPASAESASDQSYLTKPATPPVDGDLVKRIAERWKRSPDVIRDIVRYAYAHAYKDFPQPVHILAIIAIESSFNPKARSLKNVGLMQINLPANGKKLRDGSMQENIRVGSQLLNEYYGLLRKSQKAAVLGYNAGVGAYLKGRYNTSYWVKYQRELARLGSRQ